MNNAIAPEDIAALVLAGGKSARFGQEKALARLGEQTLLERAVAHLQPFHAPLAVSLQAGSQTEVFCLQQGWQILHDAQEGARGPLEGICAGLAWAHVIGKRWLVTLPCDVPFLPEGFFEKLFAACRDDRGAFAQSKKGAEPLCAVWPVSALDMLQHALAGAVHPSIQECHERIASPAVLFPDADFRNVNSEGELLALEVAMGLKRT
jgi:molybdopterin-guanine dinucleotide biosynthesis protein A